VDKRTNLLAGSFAYAVYSGELYTGSDNESVSTLITSISDLYFVVNQFALGASVFVNGSWSGGTEMQTTGIGPRAAVFMKTGSTKFFPYISSAFLLKSESLDYYGTTTGHGTILAFEFGVAHMLGKNLAELIALTYQQDTFQW
jgi:hypothetical protein